MNKLYIILKYLKKIRYLICLIYNDNLIDKLKFCNNNNNKITYNNDFHYYNLENF